MCVLKLSGLLIRYTKWVVRKFNGIYFIVEGEKTKTNL